MADAALREGAGSTGSRLLRGERDCFSQLERRFAKFKGTERSLYFSSGYMANLAVLTAIPESGDVIFSDERNHASLIDGARLSRARKAVFPHNDVAALARLMDAESGSGQNFVVVESLFSMDGDFAPLPELAELCASRGAHLIIDEAHAVGIFGASGSGLVEQTGIAESVFATVNTAGKALGVSGAFVCSSALVIEYLVQRARPFVFSTAPPPAVAASIEASLDVIAAEPGRRKALLAKAARLHHALSIPGTSHILSVVIGENGRAMAIARAMQERGFDVRAIRPPTVPTGTARLRISLNAELGDAVIDRFAEALKAALDS
jgi:8-amino-7-oxononanoate synthase